MSEGTASNMPPTKILTSSLSAIGLLVGQIWRRVRARFRGTRSGGVSHRTSATSPAARLPQEVVEMIITNFIYDTPSLLACSLTCYSWYIAVVPHLHHTLVTPVYFGHGDEKRWWPDSFQSKHKLGLFPLIKKFQVPGLDGSDLAGPRTFSPTQFDHRILRQFLSLVNVQELGIDFLDIPSFMPNIRRYFGHFSPAVRSLALREPKGSRRQIIFFIGMFQHLENLKLLYKWVDFQEEPVDDLTLVPSFVPPLRGRLAMTCFTRVGILEDMIDLFGGIRFRYMDLFSVHGMRLLLDACAETLETLRLYPHDPHVESCPQDFDLSRNISLRTFEITARYTTLDVASNLNHALSTIVSPVFPEVVVFYRDYDFWGVDYPEMGGPPTFSYTHEARGRDLQRTRFQAFQEMHKARDFKLVLCADVWHCIWEHSVGELKWALAAEKAEGGFGNFSSEPLVIHNPRESRCFPGEGCSHIVTVDGYARAQAPL